MGILILFLILEEMLSVFHIEYDVSCGAFIMLRYVPSTGFPRGSVVKNPPVVQEIQV